jgi:hypothetical protein
MSGHNDGIGAELLALKNDNGMINPVEVVRWAKDHPDSRLHGSLEWDDVVAGYRHRLWQVRTLIAVHVVDADGGRQAISLSIDRTHDGGYRPIGDIMQRPNLRQVMLDDALAELQRVQAKYQRLQELEQVWIAANEVRATRAPRRKRAA